MTPMQVRIMILLVHICGRPGQSSGVSEFLVRGQRIRLRLCEVRRRLRRCVVQVDAPITSTSKGGGPQKGGWGLHQL